MHSLHCQPLLSVLVELMVTSINPLKLIPYSRAFWGEAGLFPASYSSICSKIWAFGIWIHLNTSFPIKISFWVFYFLSHLQISRSLQLLFKLTLSFLSHEPFRKPNSFCLQEHLWSSSHVHSPPIPCSLWETRNRDTNGQRSAGSSPYAIDSLVKIV